MGNGNGTGSGSGRGAPPPPPPRSRVPHPALRSPRGAPPEPGPHSWHNSARPQPPSSSSSSSPSPRSNGEDEATTASRSPRASSGSEGEGQSGAHRHRVARKKKKESGGWESPADGGEAEAEGCGRAVARHPLPVVARVSKVNILPFGSPGGSRSGSRYSSTETLKEEEQFGVCWPNQGRTLPAGYGVYRSPSFGTSDGLAWGQPAVRVRPKLPQGAAKAKPDFGSESPHQPGLEGERAEHRKSLSNPDIATETLTLLSFLKSDLSELKVKKKGVRIGLDAGSDGCSGVATPSPGSRSAAQPPNRWAPGERPTLKDLTATLRRAKSFTCSEKSGTRRLFLQSAMKQSSSELLLATADGQDRVASDGGQRGDEDALPVVIQDQYIQEARQVFEKISRMGSQQDYGFAAEQKDSGGVEGAEVVAPTGTTEVTLRGRAESTRCLKEAESEENLARRKSVEELSGHESSVTDEGIVTEPEPVGMPFQDLHEAVDAWTLPNAGPAAGDTEMPLPAHPAAAVEDLPAGKSETPSTPGSLRRRRKFPSAGTNGMEGGSEGGTEPYRSLSDPMPHRRCSVAEEAKNFSVDSNLLGSLSAKAGIPQPAAIAGSAGSAGSDLSLGSDGPRDYSSLIRTIVSQPGAMAKLVDEKGNGKTIKKKSLSDPSRRGELPAGAFEGPGEAISELEPSIPPSSSEPILSAQPAAPGTGRGYGFDPKLADVLSPRIARRSSKKRSNRAAHQENQPPPAPAVHATKTRPATKHVRHTSEPATFVPITVPEPLVPSGHHSHLPAPAAARSPGKSFPTLQPPSLEDVTKRYMLALNSGDASPGPGDGPRSPPAAPQPRLPRCPRPPDEHGPRTKPQVDMRKHVIMTLLDTEQSYVESLRTLMQGYMKPLKQPENSLLCDPSLVDEIFDQIPELLEHHEQFLEQIHDCVQNWHEKQKVGDLLVQSFSKDVLVNIYSAYIDNFLNAKDAVRIAKEARPAFMKFLEQSMRENKEKQALSDLMIKPVQRIPRYELLVKDLLKHTPEDHPDHPFLIDAQRNIKQVAERINKGMKSAEEVERNARIVQEIESHIEGMEDLQAPLRRFLRQEMVVEVKAVGGKKDRSFFLFTDLLVCTTLKRKSGSLRRSSMSLYTAASVIDTASKYKLLWKLPLEDVDIVKGASQATNRESIQKSICRLDEDLSTLGQVSKLSETLSFPHQSLDDVIKDLMAAIHRELAEKQSLSFSMAFPPNKVELSTTKADGTESFIFEFPNPDARLGFEQAFEDAKKKLASSKNCLDPEFLKAIPIMKTRSGMQFSCASPSHGSPESSHEVWVCNSDGYVGQVCLLSIRKEPTVEACIAVCSARILCIASVPGLKRAYRERAEPVGSPSSEPMPAQPEDAGPQPCLHISISGSSLELSEPVDGGNRELVPFDSDDTDDESSPSPSGTLQSQASHSTISSSFGNEEISSCKEATAETTSSEEEQEPGFMPITGTYSQNRHGESPTDGRALRRSSRGSFTRGSLEDLLSLDPEAHQSSMWLGTEDGCIHVYQSSDNIRNRKNSMKMQHAAAVMCILYLDNQVFVSLANGELVVYQREAGRFWDPQNSKSLSLGSPGSPITKMVAVAGKLWCGCQNRVIVLNTTTLAQEHTLQVGQDSGRSVTCMVSAGTGVWVALQSSAQVRLYHATSYEQLAEADITPPVHKMLAGSDAIIRQHKAACLRITALLACKDLLWIGTSAGVVLTLAVSAKAAPALVGLSQGHTGHVRFLTAIELPDGFDVLFPLPRETGAEKASEAEKRDPSRPRAPALTLSKPKMLVISGGDGYEDFRLTSSSETVGRDDSTNHLLLWRA